MQDVLGLVRCLMAVLTDTGLCFQLQLAGRQTALRFSPLMIVDRSALSLKCSSPEPGQKLC